MYNTYACFNYVCIQWLTSEIWGDFSVQPKGSMVIHGVYIYIYFNVFSQKEVSFLLKNIYHNPKWLGRQY